MPNLNRPQESAGHSNTDSKRAVTGEPMSIGSRLFALVLGLGVLALAYWMFTNYTMFDGTENVARGRHALLKWAISIAWSRPVAVIVGLLGLLIILGGVLGGKGDDAADAEAL